jgi:hypothetical protein
MAQPPVNVSLRAINSLVAIPALGQILLLAMGLNR